VEGASLTSKLPEAGAVPSEQNRTAEEMKSPILFSPLTLTIILTLTLTLSNLTLTPTLTLTLILSLNP
jgi:hypothetical protein